MTQTVHKHLLDWSKDYSTKLVLPAFARLIHVNRDTKQPDVIAPWFIVNDTIPADDVRTFHIVGTGWEIPNSAKVEHVGSVHMSPAPFIWHVFEEKKP